MNAKVILYADTVTPAMQKAMDETSSPPGDSGEIQHRARHHAQTIQKAIRHGIDAEMKARRTVAAKRFSEQEEQFDQSELIRLLEEEMLEAAKNLEFERAAQLRDKLNEIKGVPTIKSGRTWEPEVTESDHARGFGVQRAPAAESARQSDAYSFFYRR